MVKISIEIPNELNEEINHLKIDFSPLIVDVLRIEIAKFIAIKTLSSKSKLNEEDAILLGRELKKDRFSKLEERGYI
ncbi:MAG: hypothetical protein AABY10_04775 [Nanoarchaeota archaeon]